MELNVYCVIILVDSKCPGLLAVHAVLSRHQQTSQLLQCAIAISKRSMCAVAFVAAAATAATITVNLNAHLHFVLCWGSCLQVINRHCVIAVHGWQAPAKVHILTGMVWWGCSRALVSMAVGQGLKVDLALLQKLFLRPPLLHPPCFLQAWRRVSEPSLCCSLLHLLLVFLLWQWTASWQTLTWSCSQIHWLCRLMMATRMLSHQGACVFNWVQESWIWAGIWITWCWS